MCSAETTEARDGEGRAVGRVLTSFAVEIRGSRETRDQFSGELLNLSHGGLGLRLERRVELLVRWVHETSSTRTVDVSFRLPHGGILAVVEARCRVVWSKVIGEEQSHMGLEVVEFLGSGKKALEEFLAAQTT